MPDPLRVVIGTCDGTGADINVCLGFKPLYVKVINLEDAGSLFASIEWWNGMKAVTAFVEGIKELTGTTYRQISGLTTTGIREFAGGTKLTYLSATHPHWCVVGATTDVSEAYVDGHFQRDAAADTAFKSIGDSLLGKTPTAADYGTIVTATEGFTIDSADGDLNVDGEQLMWVCFG